MSPEQHPEESATQPWHSVITSGPVADLVLGTDSATHLLAVGIGTASELAGIAIIATNGLP